MPATTYKNRTTPGVYITELDAFPPSIVGVPTAVPAFIGYTEKAEINGQPVYNKAIRVGSMADFELYFGGQFQAVYDIKPITTPNPEKDNYDFRVEWTATSPPIAHPVTSPPGDYYYYFLQGRPNSEFNLYDSMRLFYANGGGNCYVVSVGSYAIAQQQGGINSKDLKKGLDVIKEQVGPTMLVIPDAVLLPAKNTDAEALRRPLTPPQTSDQYNEVVKYMLAQCYDLQDRVALLDVYSSLSVVNKATLDEVITNFWTSVSVQDQKILSYGMAYFPFLNTSVVQPSDFTYANLQPLTTLQQILYLESQNLYGDNPSKLSQVKGYIASMSKYDSPPTDMQDVTTLNQNLSNAIPLFTNILRVLVERNSILPPSGAIAGIYNYSDGTRGVWNAPANIPVVAANETTYKLNDIQQGDLNMPLNGMAIDAIRDFVGRGPVVWGARTLDGNSNDWRYIQVRRTIIYIEQSVKNALAPFVFAPNTATTWVTVTAMVSNFLSNLWAQGGLMGAKPTDAFTVNCGLGSTMTGLDVLNGYMIVQVTLQMIHPAEFIELTFKQQMQGVG
jgi:phage tail sheath protein FI